MLGPVLSLEFCEPRLVELSHMIEAGRGDIRPRPARHRKTPAQRRQTYRERRAAYLIRCGRLEDFAKEFPAALLPRQATADNGQPS